MSVEWGSQGSQNCREYIMMYGDDDQGMYKYLIIAHITVVIDMRV